MSLFLKEIERNQSYPWGVLKKRVYFKEWFDARLDSKDKIALDSFHEQRQPLIY